MRVSLALLFLGFVTTESSAQQAYVAGGAGLSVGTGGPAPAVTVSAGYQPSPRIGFALELSVIPQLDFGGLGVDVRYLHTSASRDMDIGRATARLAWGF